MTFDCGADGAVAALLCDKLGVKIVPPFASIGLREAGKLKGGVIFTNWNGVNVEITIYAPGMLNRRLISFIANYVFVEIGCLRVSTRARRSNVLALSVNRKIGFREEGVARRYFGPSDGDDAILFGMLKEECVWLEENHGQQ